MDTETSSKTYVFGNEGDKSGLGSGLIPGMIGGALTSGLGFGGFGGWGGLGGLTYSSPDYRTSVAVVYRTDNFKEFINTLSHECAHICAHVTKSFLIKLNEEEFCEMVGDLMAETSEEILRVSRQFMKG